MKVRNLDGDTDEGGSNKSGRRSRTLLAAGLAVGLVAGTGAGVAAGWPFAAGATTQNASTQAPEGVGKREAKLREVLQSLVDDGTLSQEQLDAVIGALEAARPDKDGGRKGRDGRDGPGHRKGKAGKFGLHKDLRDAAAFVLGLDVEELGAELKSGKTLAEIAEAQGTSRQELIDALVAAAIDRATERATERIPLIVDGELGARKKS